MNDVIEALPRERAQPTAAGERISSIDVLRGMVVLGILQRSPI